jgi:DNA modification methylase
MTQKAAKKITHIKDLQPDQENARKHNPRNVGMISEALQEVGAARSIVIDEDGRVLAGNATIDAAGQEGIEKIRVIDADGDEIIAVRRSNLTKRQKTRLALYDNQTADLAEWDDDILKKMFEKDEKIFDKIFRDNELHDFGINQESVDAEPQIDRAAELQKIWGTKTGQLWYVGTHRLLCGDSTKREDVERVMEGEKAGMMVTDPPYGVEYDPTWRIEAAEKGIIGFGTKRQGKVENDDRIDWTETYNLFGGDVVYVWHASLMGLEVAKNLLDAGFILRSQIIWAKDSFSISRGHYHWQHESCFYAYRKGETGHWIGDHSQSTLWKINKNDGSDQETHGTQKPLECMARPIRNHDFEIIYDPFLGSGTTMVACQNLGRKCRAIEISPNYCAVVLQRMKDAFPELVIERIEDGQT